MKSEKKCVYLFLILFFLISACTEEKEKENYSGVSELIAERNKARYGNAEKSPKRKQVIQKKVSGQSGISTQKPNPKKEEISSVILYEQKIEIVGADSGRKMAKGIAYVNKQGQIVRIKILRE